MKHTITAAVLAAALIATPAAADHGPRHATLVLLTVTGFSMTRFPDMKTCKRVQASILALDSLSTVRCIKDG
jgi:hypothetical protein